MSARAIQSVVLVSLFAFATAHGAAPAESVDELVKAGDAYDLKLDPDDALKCYLPADKLQPENPTILLKIARQYRHQMVDVSAPQEKVRIGRVSLEYAERAAALAPRDSDAQLSPAISLGKMLPFLSTKEQVASAPRIKVAAERAITLDSKNDLAWHVLGRWNRVLADVSPVKKALGPLIYGKLPSGSNEEAVRCLQKAIALNPNRVVHHIELGRAYAQMGNAPEARKHLNRGLSMPSSEKDDPDAKARGRETLAKLRG